MSKAKTQPDQPQAQPNGQEQETKPAGERVIEDLEELRAKAAERDQFKDLAQRTRADFENYQKRNQRDREQERQYMAGQFVLDMLPILDNLERATAAANKVGETGPLVQGVGMVQQQFLDVLKRHGVKRIEAEGKPFEPHLHQALVQQPSMDHAPNTVLQVVEPGYTHHDRVLRPAKVVVSKAYEVAGDQS